MRKDGTELMEQAMAADGGSRIERSGRRFGRLQEEANGSVVSFWVALKTRRRRIIGGGR
jgi:hypothetical protein